MLTLLNNNPGSAARISRITFTPSTIAGLQLWFDSADISTLWKDTAATSPVTSDADVIARWNDKSGNGRYASQATAGNRPTYKSDFGDSMPSVWLLGSSNQYMSIQSFSVAVPYTIFLVIQTNSTLTGGADTYPLNTLVCWNRNTVGHLEILPGVTGYTHYSKTSASAFFVEAIVVPSGNITMYENNVLKATGAATPTTAATSTNMLLGSSAAGRTLNGNIREILLYNSALSTADRQSVQTYLGNKWGITIS